MSDAVQILVGDCRARLAELPEGCCQMCCTSPPYWGLRTYLPTDHPDKASEIGLEATPAEYIDKMVDVFRAVRRTLADDGTLWLNIGDCYAGSGRGGYPGGTSTLNGPTDGQDNSRLARIIQAKGSQVAAGLHEKARQNGDIGRAWVPPPDGLKNKDLVGIPWMLAFALRADGWYLRADNIWGKPNGMPESVEDRPGRAHEYVFLLSKGPTYFYDLMAVRTAPKASTITRLAQDLGAQAGSLRANGGAKTNGPMKAVRASDKQRGHSRRHDGFNDRWDAMEKQQQQQDGANLRSIWWVPPAQCKEAHFAVMPERVAEICIRAGSRPGDTVLDPFLGSGTTLAVARGLDRMGIGCELSDEYADMARRRIGLAENPQTHRDPRALDSPLFTESQP